MRIESSDRATRGRWVPFALWASYVPVTGILILFTVGVDVSDPIWSVSAWIAVVAAWVYAVSRLSVSLGYAVKRHIELADGESHVLEVDFYPMAYFLFGKYVVKHDGREVATRRPHLRSLDRVEFQLGQDPPHQAVLIVKLATDVRWRPFRLRYSWHPMLNLVVDGEVIGEV